jgi:hypothetical protein
MDCVGNPRSVVHTKDVASVASAWGDNAVMFQQGFGHHLPDRLLYLRCAISRTNLHAAPIFEK